MAKITRKDQKVFGGSLLAQDNIAVFGSLAAGSPSYSLDPDTIQSAAYLLGWDAAVINNDAPCLEDMNALLFLITRQLAYIMQTGVPEWKATTNYFTGSVVNNGSGVLYKSLADDNLNNALTDGAKWATT